MGSDLKRSTRRGMRISADQPAWVRATLASQISSQAWEKSVSLKRSPSERTPAAFTEKSKADFPSLRVSKATGDRVGLGGAIPPGEAATTGDLCWMQSMPT